MHHLQHNTCRFVYVVLVFTLVDAVKLSKIYKYLASVFMKIDRNIIVEHAVNDTRKLLRSYLHRYQVELGSVHKCWRQHGVSQYT